jgi:hypothetical protein
MGEVREGLILRLCECMRQCEMLLCVHIDVLAQPTLRAVADQLYYRNYVNISN